MALIVEDGTGKADAEAYIAVDDATTYHANRGNTAWADVASDTVREQLLRKATDYMVAAYRTRWKGMRTTAEQALDWPRNFVERDYAYGSLNGYQMIGGNYYYPSDEVPTEVARACAELALRAISEDLMPDVDQQAKREKVGPIEVEYADGAVPYKRFRLIDGMLAPFLMGSGNSIPVVRA